MNKVNINLLPVAYFDGLAVKVRFIMLTLMTVFLLLPTITQADGLFDFQMKLAQKGNAEAQFKVGEMYETGFGVKKDMVEARNWISKANAQGHETAGFKLLYWDVEKNGVTAGNKANVEALKAKAKAENPQAQYYLGKMYAYGVGVKKNSDEAINWLNKAALVGVLEAEEEIVNVREMKQRDAVAKQRAQEKKQRDLKAKQERERKARQEAQKQKQLEAKARSEKAAQQNKAAADARAKANIDATDKARQSSERQAAQIQQAEVKRREAEKQALLKKRAEEEQKRKTQFESDPCSGKSARFLSTCK